MRQNGTCRAVNVFFRDIIVQHENDVGKWTKEAHIQQVFS